MNRHERGVLGIQLVALVIALILGGIAMGPARFSSTAPSAITLPDPSEEADLCGEVFQRDRKHCGREIVFHDIPADLAARLFGPDLYAIGDLRSEAPIPHEGERHRARVTRRWQVAMEALQALHAEQQLEAVPEPGTGLLLALGITGLAARKRRRL